MVLEGLDPSLLPLSTTVVAGAFAVLLGRQYAQRRRLYQLVWSAGMVLFASASLLQFNAEESGWVDVAYRAYYFIAQFLVALLACGSLLLVNRRVGRYGLLSYAALASAFLAALAVSPLDLTQVAPDGSAGGGAGIGPPARYLSFIFTIPGTAILVATSLLSWRRTRRTYNLLIAAGIAVVALGGSLARAGVPQGLYLFNLMGIAILFFGFLRSQEVAQPVPTTISATHG